MAAALLLLALSERRAVAQDLGTGTGARPALRRVGVPVPARPGAGAVALTVLGGVTEPLTDADAAHLRIGTSAAAAVHAARFLDFAARLDARYDRHSSDDRGSDDGFLFQPELSTRLAWRPGKLGLGLEAAAWLPGGPDVGTSASAVSADGRLLLSGHTPSLVVVGYAGYRLDRSEKAAEDADRLRFGDRVALGASEYDQALVGLGLGYSLGSTLLFAEATGQLLLGAPRIAESPLWVSLGARRPIGQSGLSWEVAFDALLSARPEQADVPPLVPIEPRGQLALGLRYEFGRAEAAVAPPVLAPNMDPTQVTPPPAPPAPSVELQLLDDQGKPLERANVSIVQEDVEAPLTEVEPGRYRVDAAKPGRARLRIRAEGFQPVERDIELGDGAPLKLDVKAEQALPAGQVRGLVRSYAGKGLAASIRIEPGGIEGKTDADGSFQIDVPPGEYEIVIEAPGFVAQRRKATVEKQGVVIVNADLGKAP